MIPLEQRRTRARRTGPISPFCGPEGGLSPDKACLMMREAGRKDGARFKRNGKPLPTEVSTCNLFALRLKVGDNEAGDWPPALYALGFAWAQQEYLHGYYDGYYGCADT